MPRLDREFKAEDIIRFWQKNMLATDKKAVLAYFWALHPDISPKRGIIDLFLLLVSRLPIRGTTFGIFVLTIEIIDIVLSTSEFFELTESKEDAEELIEQLEALGDLRSELESCISERRRLRDEQIDNRQEINDLREDNRFRQSIINDLVTENQRLERQTALIPDIPPEFIGDIRVTRQYFDALRDTLQLAVEFGNTELITRIPQTYFELVQAERRP